MRACFAQAIAIILLVQSNLIILPQSEGAAVPEPAGT